MTTSTGPFGRRGALAAALVTLLLVSACTRSGDPTMGMTPPAPIGGEGLAMPTISSVGTMRSDDAAAGVRTPAEPGPADTAPLQAAAPIPAVPAASAVMSRGSAAVQFLPVVGAPPEKVAMLSEALSRSAAGKGVTIVPSGGGTAPLRLKGYLSALGEGRETVVVYVWDVVDETGNRVSRIQGQERVSASGTDPWDGVGERTLAAIADRTIEAFLAAGPAAG